MKCCAVVDTNVLVAALLSKRDDNAYLVTGNMKHYPVRDFIVTPAEMAAILEKQKAREHEETKP